MDQLDKEVTSEIAILFALKLLKVRSSSALNFGVKLWGQNKKILEILTKFANFQGELTFYDQVLARSRLLNEPKEYESSKHFQVENEKFRYWKTLIC